jgi:hypothetical protein
MRREVHWRILREADLVDIIIPRVPFSWQLLRVPSLYPPALTHQS